MSYELINWIDSSVSWSRLPDCPIDRPRIYLSTSCIIYHVSIDALVFDAIPLIRRIIPRYGDNDSISITIVYIPPSTMESHRRPALFDLARLVTRWRRWRRDSRPGLRRRRTDAITATSLLLFRHRVYFIRVSSNKRRTSRDTSTARSRRVVNRPLSSIICACIRRLAATMRKTHGKGAVH